MPKVKVSVSESKLLLGIIYLFSNCVDYVYCSGFSQFHSTEVSRH